MSANVRIYDLARELKQEPKRIIEDLRREGADVSVPSNSVTKELAEKVRNKYFPKVEAAPKRTIKVIKKAVKKKEKPENYPDEEPEEETPAPKIEEAPAEEKKKAKPAVAEEEKEEEKSPVRIKKMVAKPKAVETVEEEEEPETVEPETVDAEAEEELPEETEAVAEETVEETEAVAQEIEKPKLQTTKVLRPAGTQVKQLTLTPDAIKKGLKPGEKIAAPPKPEREKTERLKNGKPTNRHRVPAEAVVPVRRA
jgi:hypothetical protein